MPFKLPVSAHMGLLQWFQQLSVNPGSFQIELNNFGAFRNKYRPVIFVNPIMQNPLYVLQKEIIQNFSIAFPTIPVMDPELKYNPHITIAYRDLEPSMFVKAWQEYKVKNYASVFEVNSFHLLQHDRKKWNIIDTYSLLKQTLIDDLIGGSRWRKTTKNVNEESGTFTINQLHGTVPGEL